MGITQSTRFQATEQSSQSAPDMETSSRSSQRDLNESTLIEPNTEARARAQRPVSRCQSVLISKSGSPRLNVNVHALFTVHMSLRASNKPSLTLLTLSECPYIHVYIQVSIYLFLSSLDSLDARIYRIRRSRMYSIIHVATVCIEATDSNVLSSRPFVMSSTLKFLTVHAALEISARDERVMCR